jgi:hypothetical protein
MMRDLLDDINRLRAEAIGEKLSAHVLGKAVRINKNLINK